eukprot:576931_1
MPQTFKWDTVLSVVVYVVLLPFYIYGFKTWYQRRTHILFRLRYSYPEGLFLIIITLLLVHASLLRDVLHIDPLHNYYIIFTSVSLSSVSMIYGVIYYRATLTFLAYKQHQSRLCQMGITNTDGTLICKENDFNTTSPRKHVISRVSLIVYITCAVSVLVLRLLDTFIATMILSVILTLEIVIAVIIFLIVKKNKVRELIGCLLETYFTFAMSLFMVVSIFSIPDQDLRQFTAYIVYHLWALSTLYFTIYFIYKAGTTVKVSHKEHGIKPLNSLSMKNSQSKEQIQAEMKTIEDDINNKTMRKFLCNHTDYEIFSRYLAFCFCLENLMFIQRVCVFRWLIIEKLDDNTGVIQTTRTEHDYYTVKFEFAKKMYKEYNEIIGSGASDVFEQNRIGLWEICCGIYNEFIHNDSVNQVNIPYGLRTELENIFGSSGEIPSDWQSYHDFLDVFHECSLHVWDLLETVYRFRFATYLKRH